MSVLLLAGSVIAPGCALAAIAYVQGNYQAASSPQSAVTVNYSGAQTAGNLNVVIVGWADDTSQVSSVTDSKGNVYVRAVGPTLLTYTATQSIYYAKNIVAAAAGTNTLTVTFNAAVPYPDIRMAEYSGIDTTSPLDVTASATGNGSSLNSGSVTTTYGNDLLVGGNFLETTTTAPGSGYTQRLASTNGQILEDRVVAVTGSYSASSTQTTGWWVMQLATFRGASVGNDTQAPTTPTGLAASAIWSQQVNLSWTASTDNVAVMDYLVERCQGSGCSTFAQIGSTTDTTYSDTGLTASTSYTCRIRARDAVPNTSGYSSTASATTPVAGIAYIQSNYASPSTSLGAVAVDYTGVEVAGSLNVVIVGWADGTSQVSSVTDSKGNTYGRAVGPTVQAGTATQSIYYAKNVVAAAAGTNTVTVTFNASVSYPDVRIAEYAGIDTTNPLDVTAGATGSSTALSSGSVTTTAANELLVGGNFIEHATTAPGTSYTQRLQTSSQQILEDRIVSTTGSYSASATQNLSGWWIMQLAAFREASSGSDTVAPTAPTGLTATAASSTTVNLSWTASTDNVAVTGYLIERCQGAGCSTFTQIATPATSPYSDTGRSASTSYSYRVRAQDAVPNYSGYSSTATATTPALDISAPTAPTGLTATTASSTQINLSWTASTDNVGVTGYLVERCQGASCSTFSQIATPATTTYSDTGRTASTSYSYRVRAQDAVPNYSNYSSTASATTSAAPDTQAPTAPTGLTATAVSSTQVNLSWTASSDNVAVTGYSVERCQGAGCTTFSSIATPTATTFNDTGRTASTTYRYQVQARDAVPNWSLYSSIATATTPAAGDILAPTAPTGLSITAGANQIVLSWTASTDNVGVVEYRIERCQGASCSSFADIGGIANSPYTDTTAIAGLSYSYRVRARDAVPNYSGYSGTGTAIPADCD